MSEDRPMSERELAEAIRAAAAVFNQAVRAAVTRGLFVEADTSYFSEIGKEKPYPVLKATVSRFI